MQILFKAFYIVVLTICIIAAVVLSGATVSGFFGAERYGQYAWLFDFFSHFRVQYVLAQLLLLLLFSGIWLVSNPRFKGITAIALFFNAVFLFLNSTLLIPYYLPQAKQQPITQIRIFHLNLWGGKNQQLDSVVNAIQSAEPDIISLQEYNNWWKKNLGAHRVLNAYPYRFLVPWGDDAIYSKRLFEKVYAEHIPGSPNGADVSIVAKLKLGGQLTTLLFSHPPTPIKPDLYKRLKQHYQFWGSNRKSYGNHFAIIGDLNSSPWSAPFQQLLKQTQLQDSQLGFGVQPSFPTYSILRRVPIDHCLVSQNFVVMDRKIGQNVGSDHFPVIIDLGLKR